MDTNEVREQVNAILDDAHIEVLVEILQTLVDGGFKVRNTEKPGSTRRDLSVEMAKWPFSTMKAGDEFVVKDTEYPYPEMAKLIAKANRDARKRGWAGQSGPFFQRSRPKSEPGVYRVFRV